MKINEILLRRKNKVLFTMEPKFEVDTNTSYVCTICKNIENLGYVFSEVLFEALTTLTIKELGSFYINLVEVLEDIKGADVQYNPMYPNFPKQVMELDEVELYINAIIHYWSNGSLLPVTKKEKRLPLFDEGTIEVLEIGSLDDLKQIFVNLVNSKTSLSESDKNDLEWFFKEMNALVYECMPETIPLKENVALISKLLMQYMDERTAIDKISVYVKTATDVLRLATALSDGDISLADNTKYKSFSRKERRILLGLLENCGSIEEDMVRFKTKWIRLGEKLHPGEFSKQKYMKTHRAFYKLRNNKKITTFNGRVDACLKEDDIEQALKLLVKRPGELARKLDFLLRTINNKNLVINSFNRVAANVATPVLLQIRQHFINRNVNQEYRVFFPKGQLAKSYNLKNNLPEIEEKYCKAIVSICENALIENYKQKDFMGNVYLAEELKNYVVPFSQRSASKVSKTITRGSRIKLDPNTKIVRGFIWWTNHCEGQWDNQRVDIDLSAAIFDEKWRYKDHVSYTNLCSTTYNAYHSGDIVNGGVPNGNGVAEFIDIDIDSIIKYGARYVVFQVYCFSGYPFSVLENARFGWMERQDCNSGEIFEPKTMKQKIDLVANTVTAVPVIFDCFTKEFIWCDMSINLDSCRGHWGNSGANLEHNLSTVEAICYSVTCMNKPNMYDLIDLHIKAHGVRTESKEDADIIFDINDGITPYDLDVFMGEYL